LTVEDLDQLKTIFEQLAARARRAVSKRDSPEEHTVDSLRKVSDLLN
jgi:hypothetical protein